MKKWRDIAVHTATAAVVGSISALAAKLSSYVPIRAFSLVAKFTILITLLIFVAGTIYSFVDVLWSHAERSGRSKWKLEIKAKDGSVLATNVDPADIQKIAKVVEEAKGASQ